MDTASHSAAPGPPVRARHGPDVAHGGHLLQGWLGAAVSCLLLALAAAAGGALWSGPLAAAAPALRAAARELLSWGFVPLAAGALAIWRRSAAPMPAAARELLYLAAALWLTLCAAALGVDVVVGGQLSGLTLPPAAAVALGCGLLSPVAVFGLRGER